MALAEVSSNSKCTGIHVCSRALWISTCSDCLNTNFTIEFRISADSVQKDGAFGSLGAEQAMGISMIGEVDSS
jgi:hypothetical protein